MDIEDIEFTYQEKWFIIERFTCKQIKNNFEYIIQQINKYKKGI